MTTEGPTAEEFLADHPLGLAALAWVRRVVVAEGACHERVGRSQVAFRRRRGFAYLWLPGQYLDRPASDVVLSVALGHRDGSPRWKQVAHPAPDQWMHHLELRSEDELDDQVAGWVREAWARAG